MNYGIAILFFLLPVYMYNLMNVHIACLLDGRKMLYRKVFTLLIPVSVGQALAYSALMFIGSSPNIIIDKLLSVLFRASEIAIYTLWICFLFRDTDNKKRFFYTSTAFPFHVLSAYGSNALSLAIAPEWGGVSFNDFVWTPYAVFLMVFLSFSIPVGAMFITWLSSKTNFWRKLQAFGEYPKLYVPMGIICFLFYIIFGVVYENFLFHDYPILFMLGLYIFYIALLVLVVLIVSDIKRTENLNAAQSLLLQQQNYINKLESIQQEIRSIQHDYKNMLLGLYAQASEGDTEAVKEYIDTKLLKVDETVRENLSQMNQLTRIEIPKLKGLILTKMLEAERDKVSFRLEVMFSVSRTSMATEDLLRCVGILLDNAIEEAQKQEGATLTLLLLQEDGTLTVVVKNSVRDIPDLAKIRNGGYSTKGPGRGIGLSNYQNIVRKYPNATQETKIEGEYFVQTMVLPEN